jgi:transmembrane sensor
MSTENENNLYARWLNNELTGEERNELQKNGDEEVLIRIIKTVDEWTLPELEANTFEQIQSKLSSSKEEAKVVPLFKRPAFLAIAASVILLVGLFALINPFGTSAADMTEMACNAGETKQFTLPDNTVIILYGKSKIKYDKKHFNDKRVLNLEGEAYFEVNRKGAFEVDFAQGQVNVLGTKFNILTGPDAAVKCYEGKVKVELEKNSAVLTQGMGVRKSEKGGFSQFTFTEELPSAGSYRLIQNAPLDEVCNTLSVFYDIKVINENVDLNRKFSGSMSLVNVDTALTMIFSPMDIEWKRESNTVTIKNK